MTLDPSDHQALRALVDAYGMAVDQLDVVWFAALWTRDAVLAVHDATGEVRRWRGAEVPRIVDGVRRYHRTFHFVGNHRVVADSDDAGVASGQTYCFAHHLRERDGAWRDRIVAIRYDDRYRRLDGVHDAGWRLAGRDVRILWRAHQPIDSLGWEP